MAKRTSRRKPPRPIWWWTRARASARERIGENAWRMLGREMRHALACKELLLEIVHDPGDGDSLAADVFRACEMAASALLLDPPCPTCGEDPPPSSRPNLTP